ncbi:MULTISPECIES: nickel permease HupE [Rhizobium]|uniref:Protein HupE n=3 Tax=Rhizobium leguminosarum TaxID=384 RepID=HUPE_RHILV|nr:MULTISPECIES: HupE/UreJ family protein [Rhizobium]P27650.1 RecName: Full=Protein HupE; Flags: Precursor [Rhizobium leguminosarum bv. viciae]AVC45436.1 hupE / UreJ family protein [Rhizobium leguminosarum bv. viciae]MBY5315518.1 HupE/UreJ family protein [Rhizobium leguminosarum]MBY5503313.1 HupE/UreJ family protein [Rhizobium leguminosarum]NEJ95452.1 urease accessory protein [Rhizobium ruizarguesonis]NKJ78302.1 urease accessory protein [Rhizobium leguminosarum bv. viciae]
MKYSKITTTLAALALPSIAHAHVGLHADGTLAGLNHPFSGLDHILAMVAVGFWASTLGGKAVWIVPSAFVIVMAGGGVLGIEGIALPMVETAIALTVAMLGLLVAFEVKIPTPVAAIVVGICALFHGHVHGIELPTMSNATGYVAGFLAATVILHVLGIGLASLRFGKAGQVVARVAGGAVALAGAALLVG